jgi:hypothetical protein
LGSTTPTCPSCGSEDAERLHSLFAVSSESTRRASVLSARQEKAPEAREKAIAEEESVRKHVDH